MVSICKNNNSVNSFFGLPPSMEEDHFSHAFHQTPCLPSLTPQKNPTFIFNSINPIKPINLYDSNSSFLVEKSENSCSIDLMSCTENLGFESSDEMVTSFDDLGWFKKSDKNDKSSSSTTTTSSSSSSCLNGGLMRKRREKRVSKSEFPPPLTTLDENRRRNFVMKSVRENGRLKIVGVMIQRPETLCAIRDNGRLRMNLVQSASSSDSESSSDDDDDDVGDDENHDLDVNDDGDENHDEKELKIPASGGLRRCYDHHQQHQHVWGPQQNRCVTTI